MPLMRHPNLKYSVCRGYVNAGAVFFDLRDFVGVVAFFISLFIAPLRSARSAFDTLEIALRVFLEGLAILRLCTTSAKAFFTVAFISAFMVFFILLGLIEAQSYIMLIKR